MSRRRLIVALAVVLAPLAFLAWEALFDPEIEFLRPSLRGRWIVDRSMPIEGVPPYSPEAIYVHGFALFEKPTAFPIRITAMREFEAVVNGDTLPVARGRSWKHGQTYDLAPSLKARTFNSVSIRVRNPKGPPALLVEGPREVRSGTHWRVLVGPAFQMPREPGVALRDESYLEPDPNPLRASPRFCWYAAGLIAYGLFIVYAVVPWRGRAGAEIGRGSGDRIARSASRPVRSVKTSSGRAAREPGKNPAGQVRPGHTPEGTPGLRSPGSTEPRPPSFWRRHGAALALLLAVGAFQVRNALVYPRARGADFADHAFYINTVADHGRIPDPREGVGAFQPPLYYVTAAPIARLVRALGSEEASWRAVQVYTTLVALGGLAAAWWMLWALFPTQGRARFLGFSVSAMLPLGLYTNPQVTNEVFAGAATGLALALAVRCAFRSPTRYRDAALVGVGCGLALLSKYTAVFVFLSVMVLIGLRVLDGWFARLTRRKSEDRIGRLSPVSDRALGMLSPDFRRPPHLRWGLAVAAVTLLLCGWLYARNVILFGKAFVGNWDEETGHASVFEQEPGYRTLGYYLRFGSVLFHAPKRSRFAGFADGVYGSLWTDSHGFYLGANDRMVQTTETLVLWLALLPSAAIVLGFGLAVRSLLKREWDHPYLVLVLTTFGTVLALLQFGLQLPFYSTIHARFVISLTGAVGVFAALGLEAMCRRLGRLRWILYAALAVLYALTLHLFWYRPTWQWPSQST